MYEATLCNDCMLDYATCTYTYIRVYPILNTFTHSVFLSLFMSLAGFLSWDVSDCHVDLEEELNTITQHAPEGEEARHGKSNVK